LVGAEEQTLVYSRKRALPKNSVVYEQDGIWEHGGARAKRLV
jgi:hypothetical protein